MVMTVLLALAMSLHAYAQSSDIPKVSSAYALTNATVIPEPGMMLENTTVIIEDGLITAVGAKVPIPVYARVIRCDSMYLYPGFIEGISHTGIPTRKEDQSERGDSERVDDPGNPPNDKAGVTPEKSAAEAFTSSDKSVSDMRELGFTASHVVPRDGMLPGKGAIILLGDGESAELAVAEGVSMYAQFDPARRMYPGTTIGVMAKWRDLYREAQYMSKHKEVYESSTSGTRRPKYDKATEAMFDVTEGSIPVFFNVPDALDIHKALDLKETLGFDITLCEINQSWLAMDRILAAGVPVFVSMELPEKPKEEKKKDDEEKEVTPEEEAWELKRTQSYDDHMKQAAMLARSGLPTSFSMLEVKSKDLRPNLLRMIENGLDPDTALAALTTVPAEVFGVDGYMGTVTAGKMANVFVSNKPYFEEDSKVKYVFVEGKMYEYEIKEEKKKTKSDADGDEPAADIKGKWSFEVDVMGQVYTGVFTFNGTDGDYSGEMTSDDDGSTTGLDDVSVTGKNLTFSMLQDNEGMQMMLDFDLDIDNDVFEGEVSVGEFGAFEVEGARIPN